jgi:hypothetical protein
VDRDHGLPLTVLQLSDPLLHARVTLEDRVQFKIVRARGSTLLVTHSRGVHNLSDRIDFLLS